MSVNVTESLRELISQSGIIDGDNVLANALEKRIQNVKKQQNANPTVKTVVSYDFLADDLNVTEQAAATASRVIVKAKLPTNIPDDIGHVIKSVVMGSEGFKNRTQETINDGVARILPAARQLMVDSERVDADSAAKFGKFEKRNRKSEDGDKVFKFSPASNLLWAAIGITGSDLARAYADSLLNDTGGDTESDETES